MTDHTPAPAAARFTEADVAALSDATGIGFTVHRAYGRPPCLAAAHLGGHLLRSIVRAAMDLHPDNGPLISALATPDTQPWTYGTLTYWPGVLVDAADHLVLTADDLTRLRRATGLDATSLSFTDDARTGTRALTVTGDAADAVRTAVALSGAHPGHSDRAANVVMRRTIDGHTFTWPTVHVHR